MEEIIKKDETYMAWINGLSEKYRQSQIKAATSVNSEMLKFYWELGKDIHELHIKNKRGSDFFVQLSKDLKQKIPGAKCFSETNLRYMERYYKLFSNLPQVGADLFCVPWGHLKLLMDKCRNNPEKAGFFLKKTIENNWSRAVPLNFLDTDLYERQGKAISNFEERLPSVYGQLAQELTKDPYNFDFLTIQEDYNEKGLKDALMDNIQYFLMELGSGFAFVGREYRLTIGKTKDNVLEQYATESSSQPIGISEYHLSNLLPENYKNMLPTIEEIEMELNR